jgi:hypothetical protein
VVAVDGKALRGAFERGRKTTPLHLVNVWAAEARLAIAQRLAPKRNEVAAALEALDLLSLNGCIVTTDALHCHAGMAQRILDRGGQYVLALKENQSALFAEAQTLLEHCRALPTSRASSYWQPWARRAAAGCCRARHHTANFPFCSKAVRSRG